MLNSTQLYLLCNATFFIFFIFLFNIYIVFYLSYQTVYIFTVTIFLRACCTQYYIPQCNLLNLVFHFCMILNEPEITRYLPPAGKWSGPAQRRSWRCNRCSTANTVESAVDCPAWRGAIQGRGEPRLVPGWTPEENWPRPGPEHRREEVRTHLFFLWREQEKINNTIII